VIDVSTTVSEALLNGLETTIGAAPSIKLFSGTLPADCAAADPSGHLVTITIPSDWMGAASGTEKFQNGPWSGVAVAAGTIACFRLYDASAVCHMQGSVTVAGGGGDLILKRVDVSVGTKVNINRFRLFLPIVDVPLPVVVGTFSKTQTSQTLTGRGQVTVVVPEPIGDRVQWVDTEVGDMPTYEFANSTLWIPWSRGTETRVPIQKQAFNGLPQQVGGDWLDLNGTGNGSVPFGTIPATTFNGVAKWVTVTSAGMIALVNKFLIAGDNTGILVKEQATQNAPAYFSSRHAANGNFPEMIVVTNVNTYICPCTADTYWEDTGYATRGMDTVLRPRFICKFDFSAVSGTVTSATLRLYYQASGGPALGVYFLDMPKLIYAPAEQLPDQIEYGIARDVAQDTDLANHPSVLFYPTFTDAASFSTQWQWMSVNPAHPGISFTDEAGGLKAIRVFNSISGNTATNARNMWVNRPISINNRRTDLEMPFQQAYEHLFLRYMITLENDVAQRLDPAVTVPGYGAKRWSNWDGTKLPGLQGIATNYPDYKNPLPGRSWQDDGYIGLSESDGPYSLIEHDEPSLANDRAMAASLYCYDEDTSGVPGRTAPDNPDGPVSQGFSGGGRTEFIGTCFKPNRTYCLEQEVILNTIAPGGTPVRDGVVRVWMDGVKIYERTDRMFRRNDQQRWYTADQLILHGGNGPPAATQHYRLFGWCVATEYIGPPQSLPAWRSGRTVDTFAPITNTSNLGGLALSPFPEATVDDNQAFAIGTYQGRLKLTYAACGGHNNTWRNAVYQLDLSDDAPAWVKLHPGSDVSAVVVNVPYFTDGLPASRHTYYHTHHIEPLNRVMNFTISGLWGNGGTTAHVDAFQLDGNTWEVSGSYPNNFSPYPNSPTVAINTGITAVCKHPVTNDVYIAADYKFTKWSPLAPTTYTQVLPGLTTTLGAWQAHGTCIDTIRNRWVCLYSTGFITAAPAVLKYINLADGTHGEIAVSLNGAAFSLNPYAQMVHDLDNDRYIFIHSFHSHATPCPVYALNPTTGVITQISTMTPNPYNGMNGRLAYVPSLGGVVCHPRYSSHVLFMPTR
jgi:hypothetical protein